MYNVFIAVRYAMASNLGVVHMQRHVHVLVYWPGDLWVGSRWGLGVSENGSQCMGVWMWSLHEDICLVGLL